MGRTGFLAMLVGVLLVGSCSSEVPDSGHIFEPETTWGDPQVSGEPWITFGPMAEYQVEHEGGFLEKGQVGEFTGNDGCNMLGGKYSYMSPMAFVEGPMTTTEMYCEDVDTWLSGFHSAEIEGDELVVYDVDGDEIGRLPRAD